MSTAQILVLIVIVLVVVVIALVARQVARRRSLRKTFGPEYDRVVAEKDSRTAAEQELRDRERRHSELELTPLTPESKARYSASWEEVQIRFVDAPDDAVGTADDLVTRLIAERGYPTGSYDDQLATLSVEHAKTLEHYRDAHEISRRSERGEASTEDLRQALVHYRVLFADLLGEDPVRTDTSVHNAGPAPGRHEATPGRPIPTQRSDRSDAQRPDNRVDGSRPDATSR